LERLVQRDVVEGAVMSRRTVVAERAIVWRAYFPKSRFFVPAAARGSELQVPSIEVRSFFDSAARDRRSK
jgi:hypothetical protein